MTGAAHQASATSAIPALRDFDVRNFAKLTNLSNSSPNTEIDGATVAKSWKRPPASKHRLAQQKSGTPQRAAQVRIISKQLNPKTTSRYFFVKYSTFTGVKLCHFSGKSSNAKIAVTGHTGTHAPQSMHSAGLMKSCFTPS
jgi:hypothetical protein